MANGPELPTVFDLWKHLASEPLYQDVLEELMRRCQELEWEETHREGREFFERLRGRLRRFCADSRFEPYQPRNYVALRAYRRMQQQQQRSQAQAQNEEKGQEPQQQLEIPESEQPQGEVVGEEEEVIPAQQQPVVPQAIPQAPEEEQEEEEEVEEGWMEVDEPQVPEEPEEAAEDQQQQQPQHHHHRHHQQQQHQQQQQIPQAPEEEQEEEEEVEEVWMEIDEPQVPEEPEEAAEDQQQQQPQQHHHHRHHQQQQHQQQQQQQQDHQQQQPQQPIEEEGVEEEEAAQHLGQQHYRELVLRSRRILIPVAAGPIVQQNADNPQAFVLPNIEGLPDQFRRKLVEPVQAPYTVVHGDGGNVAIVCGIGGCGRHFNTIRGWKVHSSRVHVADGFCHRCGHFVALPVAATEPRKRAHMSEHAFAWCPRAAAHVVKKRRAMRRHLEYLERRDEQRHLFIPEV